MRAYYQDSISNFCNKDNKEILGTLSNKSQFDIIKNQTNAWHYQVKSLQKILKDFSSGYILFEFNIPRIGKRIDNILIYKNIIFILEFKVGQSKILNQDIDQVLDYALDLQNFHKESHDKIIAPILLATDYAKTASIHFSKVKKNTLILQPSICNLEQLYNTIEQITNTFKDEATSIPIEYKKWLNSPYYPTPTIIEAAQALYREHDVKDISRADASIKNLTETTAEVSQVIEYCKKYQKKGICFITGVPGAGKTLAGLNIANSRQSYKEEELATFLSGNGPLVNVLREALARDKKEREHIPISEARREVASFIQNIHHFRDDALNNLAPPAEKVVIFDEAQRAWDQQTTSQFMKSKRGQIDFNQSEPEFLINVMNRTKGWTVIVCLIGNGQEINRGEAGLEEWFKALNSHKDWELYIPNNLKKESGNILTNFPSQNIHYKENLYLSASIRSFRSEHLSLLIHNILTFNETAAHEIYRDLQKKYPIAITRSLHTARVWLRNQAKGSERTGIVASSEARRLKKEGIYVQRKFQEIPWFLNDKDDVRSSYYLEEVATEFDIQGLELDWVCVAWDLDLQITENEWDYRSFTGTKWNNINKLEDQAFRLNAYRVLLTRARQGMIIYIPQGDADDHTRPPAAYEKIYQYLKQFAEVIE